MKTRRTLRGGREMARNFGEAPVEAAKCHKEEDDEEKKTERSWKSRERATAELLKLFFPLRFALFVVGGLVVVS
jgi:hypothetical protein